MNSALRKLRHFAVSFVAFTTAKIKWLAGLHASEAWPGAVVEQFASSVE